MDAAELNELERDSDGEFERFVCVVECIVRVLYAPTSGGSVVRSVMATRGFSTDGTGEQSKNPPALNDNETRQQNATKKNPTINEINTPNKRDKNNHDNRRYEYSLGIPSSLRFRPLGECIAEMGGHSTKWEDTPRIEEGK